MTIKIGAFIPNHKFLLTISLLCLSLLPACSPFYVLRAAFEEGKILWRREPIEELLKKPDLSPETREKYKLVLAVREYARDTVKLRVGGSYSSFSYVERSVLSYVLTAVPKTDLNPYTWWFLFVGRVPYKGFFSEEAAKSEAESFHAQGYDTSIRTSQAYSTLGWFDDPLLAHLLKYDKVTLAEVIFHELFHSTLFISGAVDFNESLANFVGNRATIRFFQENYGDKSPEHLKAIRSWEEELEFSVFLNEVVNSLKELYGKKDLPSEEKLRLKEEIFTRSQMEWSSRIVNRPNHQYRGYSGQTLDNAIIVHYLLYLKDLELFESLFQVQGMDLGRMVELIGNSVEDGQNPFEDVKALLRNRAA
ncbi:MAG: aminopeptidase [Candidatus Binatia bacterium]